MVPSLHISDADLQRLRGQMAQAAIDIGMISSGAYVTSGIFTLSKGQSVDAMNAMLDALVSCTNSLQMVAGKLADYLNMVLIEFDDDDARMAQWLANFDVAPPNPEDNPVAPGEGGSPSIPHENIPTNPAEPPQ